MYSISETKMEGIILKYSVISRGIVSFYSRLIIRDDGSYSFLDFREKEPFRDELTDDEWCALTKLRRYLPEIDQQGTGGGCTQTAVASIFFLGENTSLPKQTTSSPELDKFIKDLIDRSSICG